MQRHQIYMAIIDKYKNNIIPQIPLLIIPYVLENKDKVNLYLDRKIKIGNILKYLNKKSKEKGQIKIMDEIIEFVEGKQCSNT